MSIPRLSRSEYATTFGEKILRLGKISTISLLIAGTLSFCGFAGYRYFGTDKLTANEDDINSFYSANSVNSSYSYLSEQNGFTRLSVLANKPVKFNILMDEITEKEKEELTKSINELNAIFEVINPAYKFEIDFSPSAIDTLDPYNVDVDYMTEKEDEEHPNALAFYNANHIWAGKNGDHGYCSKIKFRPGKITAGVFTHEILHHLGLGDAYLAEDAHNTPSVMHSGENVIIRKNDIALLAARYGDYSTQEKMEELTEYINSYEQNQDWYKELYSNAAILAKELKPIILQHHNTTEENISFLFPENTIYIKDRIFAPISDYISITKIEQNKYESSTANISASLKNNKIQPVKYNNTTNYDIIQIEGIPCVNFKIFYYFYNNTLYKAQKVEDWIFTEASMISKTEYESLSKKQEEIINTPLEQLLEKSLEKINELISPYARDNFDFDEFTKHDFKAKNLSISYNENTDIINYKRYTTIESDYHYYNAGNYMLIGNYAIVYQNYEGKFCFAHLTNEKDTENLKMYDNLILEVVENIEENENELN